MDSKCLHEFSDSNVLNKRVIRIFFLQMSFGSFGSLVGISFHSFAPILENDFRSISSLDFFNIKVVGN